MNFFERQKEFQRTLVEIRIITNDNGFQIPDYVISYAGEMARTTPKSFHDLIMDYLIDVRNRAMIGESLSEIKPIPEIQTGSDNEN